MRETSGVERLRQNGNGRGKNQRGRRVAVFGSPALLCSLTDGVYLISVPVSAAPNLTESSRGHVL